MRIDHIAMYVKDLEKAKEFFLFFLCLLKIEPKLKDK